MMPSARESDNVLSEYSFYIIPSKMLMLQVLPSHSSNEKSSAHWILVPPLLDSVFPSDDK